MALITVIHKEKINPGRKRTILPHRFRGMTLWPMLSGKENVCQHNGSGSMLLKTDPKVVSNIPGALTLLSTENIKPIRGREVSHLIIQLKTDMRTPHPL